MKSIIEHKELYISTNRWPAAYLWEKGGWILKKLPVPVCMCTCVAAQRRSCFHCCSEQLRALTGPHDVCGRAASCVAARWDRESCSGQCNAILRQWLNHFSWYFAHTVTRTLTGTTHSLNLAPCHYMHRCCCQTYSEAWTDRHTHKQDSLFCKYRYYSYDIIRWCNDLNSEVIALNHPKPNFHEPRFSHGWYQCEQPNG